MLQKYIEIFLFKQYSASLIKAICTDQQSGNKAIWGRFHLEKQDKTKYSRCTTNLSVIHFIFSALFLTITFSLTKVVKDFSIFVTLGKNRRPSTLRSGLNIQFWPLLASVPVCNHSFPTIRNSLFQYKENATKKWWRWATLLDLTKIYRSDHSIALLN